MLNYYGLKVKGIKKVVSVLQANFFKDSFRRDLAYLQVNYNFKSGELWGDFLQGCNDWRKVYHDKNIITIARYRKARTMQEVLNDIRDAMRNELINN